MAPGLRPLVFGCFFFLLSGSICYVTVKAEETRKIASTPSIKQQRETQAETERTARRIATVLRMLAYHKVEEATNQATDHKLMKQLLQETADSLSKLSREEMNAVLAYLEKAASALDAATANDQERKARAKNRDIVDQLKSLVLRYDLIKTLDVAATRLEQSAKAQFEIQLSAQNQIQRIRDRRGNPNRGLADDYEEQADSQHNLKREIDNVFIQLGVLEKHLNPEQKDWLRKSDALARGKKISEIVDQAQKFLKQNSPMSAVPNQEKAAAELLELAAALRSPRDKLEVLREARTNLDKAIQAQEDVRTETAKKPEPVRNPKAAIDQKSQQAQDLASKEARIEFDAKETRANLKDASKELADAVKPAEEAIHKATEELRQTPNDPKKPLEKEEKALDALKDARKAVDEMLAKEKARRTDPLEAVKAAKEKVEQLIKDQTKTREDTEKTKGTQNEKLPMIAQEQKDIEKRTEELKNSPLPEKPEVKQALEEAVKAQEKAAKALDAKKGLEAVEKQDEAIKDLQAAKKALEDQAKAIEERRQEIADLEKADKKLGELAKKQEEIADKARDQDKQGKTDKADELAKDQGELKPQAKEVGDMIKDLAPEAAKKIDMSGEKMDDAKANLEEKKLPPAAKDGDAAKEKLQDAQKEIAKKLDEKKAMEAIDQQALKPNEVNPKNAAQEVAKALEQTEKAEKQAEEAAKQLGMEPMKGEPMKNQAADLQKLQEQVAEKAKELKQPKAQEAAEKAAMALEKGELQKAVENQQKAAEALEPMMGEPMMGEPKNGEPMMGDPKPGDPKNGEPMMGDPKNGEPMMGNPKMGMGMGKPMAPNPAAAKDPAQLAQAQKQIQKATEALKQAQQANNSAQAAIQQAQATAPDAVQPQLNQAQEQLQQAQQQLGEASPAQAQQAQQQAQQALQQALQTLNKVQEQQMAKGMGMEPGMGMGMEPGMGMGEPKPGMGEPKPGMSKGKPMGKSTEDNRAVGKGDRNADSSPKTVASSGQDAKGDGAFINLPAKQREMIQQALATQLPPEFAAMISQYNKNVNSKKPATGGTSGNK